MNPNMWPNSPALIESLKKLDFFACVDFFHTPATEVADIVFPAATSLEREALVTSTRCHYRGNIQYRKPVAGVNKEGPRSDAQILLDLGCRLGMPELFWNGDVQASIQEQAEELDPGLWRALQKNSDDVEIFGKVVMDEALDGQTHQLYEKKGFSTFSGKVEFYSDELRNAGYDGLPVYREPLESPVSTPAVAKKFPLVLTTGGRSIAFVHSQQRKFKRLRNLDPHPRIQIHPDDARSRGIEDGKVVMISSPRGAVEMVAEVTDRMLGGSVHAYHGWGSANVNVLTDDQQLDPISGFPAYKSTLCEVSLKVDKA
jgi:anaerobic selenocysteine-containing dehydrogenase